MSSRAPPGAGGFSPSKNRPGQSAFLPKKLRLWVIFDWASRRFLSSDARFAPKATEVLRGREMTRWARSGRVRAATV
jgi:hypothetical protein